MGDRLFSLEQEQQRLRAKAQSGLSSAQFSEDEELPQPNRLMALEQSLDLSRQLGCSLGEVELKRLDKDVRNTGSIMAIQMGRTTIGGPSSDNHITPVEVIAILNSWSKADGAKKNQVINIINRALVADQNAPISTVDPSQITITQKSGGQLSYLPNAWLVEGYDSKAKAVKYYISIDQDILSTILPSDIDRKQLPNQPRTIQQMNDDDDDDDAAGDDDVVNHEGIDKDDSTLESTLKLDSKAKWNSTITSKRKFSNLRSDTNLGRHKTSSKLQERLKTLENSDWICWIYKVEPSADFDLASTKKHPLSRFSTGKLQISLESESFEGDWGSAYYIPGQPKSANIHWNGKMSQWLFKNCPWFEKNFKKVWIHLSRIVTQRGFYSRVFYRGDKVQRTIAFCLSPDKKELKIIMDSGKSHGYLWELKKSE